MFNRREYQKEYSKQYYQLHKDKARKAGKRWRKNNPEKAKTSDLKYRKTHRMAIRKRGRHWYQQNSERHKSKMAEWYQQNKEYWNKKCKEWYESNKEYAREYAKQQIKDYYKRNPDKRKENSRKYRIRKRNAIGHHTEKEWRELKQMYNYTCLCCDKQEPEITLTRDHVIQLSDGGTDNIDNIQPLCRSCNSKKLNTDFRRQLCSTPSV